MAWTTEFAGDALRDLGLIFDHLFESYLDLGESVEEAVQRAATRVEQIEAQAERIATAPQRGEGHDDLLPNLRHLTLDRAIYWFVPDPETEVVQILAIFYGGQNHRLHMLARLLSEEEVRS